MIMPNVRGFFEPVTATWSYVVYAESGNDKRCAIIDSVLDYDQYSGRTSTHSADVLLEFVKQRGLEVQWILETHIHADHITASAYLKEKLGGQIGVSRNLLKILDTWQPILQNQNDTPLDGSQFDHLFEDNEKFSVGPFEAYIIPTPGHTPADTSYIIADAVFCGDTMFMPDVGTGRCDFPGGSSQALFQSCQKLLALPDDFRVYVGHDYPPSDSRAPQCMSTVHEQKSQNVRLRGNVTQEDFSASRDQDDTGKDVPKLLFPSIQVNLRGGKFGDDTGGVQFVKIPVNKI